MPSERIFIFMCEFNRKLLLYGKICNLQRLIFKWRMSKDVNSKIDDSELQSLRKTIEATFHEIMNTNILFVSIDSAIASVYLLLNIDLCIFF